MKDKKDEKDFRLRLRPELFAKLEWVADKEGRSINKQIVRWLEDAVEKWETENPKENRQQSLEPLAV